MENESPHLSKCSARIPGFGKTRGGGGLSFALSGNRGAAAIRWLLFALLSAARFCALGAKYYPQLDDYIQYYKYTALCSPPEAVIKYGMLAARPLSNAADVFVWAKFWPNLFWAVIIISILYAASALLFLEVFAALFPSFFKGGGTAFLLFYLLLPLNIEGTYWLSASTRVVSGLFWASLSARLFVRWLEGGGAWNVLAFALFQLLAMASYEQSLMLSAALTLMIAYHYRKKSGRRALFTLVTLSNGLLYWAFVLQFRENSPLYSSAYEAVLPHTAYFWHTQLPHVLKQFAAAFVGGGVMTLAKGALRGAVLVIGAKPWFLVITLLCSGLVALYLIFSGTIAAASGTSRNAYGSDSDAGAESSIFPLLFGLILAAAPLAPHVIKANPWFSLRGTVTSFPGLGLCLMALGSPVLRRAKQSRAFYRAAAGASAAFVALCFFAAASELEDYRLTYENDQAVMAAIAEAIDLVSIKGRVALLGVMPNYLPDQNYYYHEHIHGVTESDWALSGALYAYSGGKLDPAARFVPLYGDAAEQVLSGEIGGFDEIYIYDSDTGLVRADINR